MMSPRVLVCVLVGLSKSRLRQGTLEKEVEFRVIYDFHTLLLKALLGGIFFSIFKDQKALIEESK
jgi:hypothetical protein